MADSQMIYREFRFVIEDELTHAFVLIEARGDSPLGVQGWHHKAFPASKTVLDIFNTMFGINGAEHDAPVLWPQQSPKEAKRDEAE